MNHIGVCSGLKCLRENFDSASVLKGHDFSRAVKGPIKVARALALEGRASISRVRLCRVVLRQNRSAVLKPRGRVHHLAGLRFGEAELAGHSVDAAGAAELRFAKAELAVLFAELIHHLLLGLDAIRVLDGIEVLEAINHDQREEHRAGCGEDTHLPRTNRIGCLDQSRIVEAVRKENFRRSDSATTHGLLR